jgi:hypothetical protein
MLRGGQKLPLKMASLAVMVGMRTCAPLLLCLVMRHDRSGLHRAEIGGAHAVQLGLLGACSDGQPDGRLRP